MWSRLLSLLAKFVKPIIVAAGGTLAATAAIGQLGWLPWLVSGPEIGRYRLLASRQPGEPFLSVPLDYPFQSGQEFRVQIELADGSSKTLDSFLVGRNRRPDPLCSPCISTDNLYYLPPDGEGPQAMRLDDEPGRESLFLMIGASKQFSGMTQQLTRDELEAALLRQSGGCVATAYSDPPATSDWVWIRPGTCGDRPLLVEIKVDHQSSYTPF